jgi:hypothetical protein
VKAKYTGVFFILKFSRREEERNRETGRNLSFPPRLGSPPQWK